jgi:hypothetical protein
MYVDAFGASSERQENVIISNGSATSDGHHTVLAGIAQALFCYM